MHLLVYFLADGPGPLQDRLGGLQAARADRNRRIVDRAQRPRHRGHPGGDPRRGRRRVGGPAPRRRRPDAQGLRRARCRRRSTSGWPRGSPPTWTGSGCRRRRPSPWPTPRGRWRCWPTRRRWDSNGPTMERFIAGLAADGLDGMECEYGRYSPDLREALRKLAGRLGLAVTGGSDYHGRYKPDLALGTGTGRPQRPRRSTRRPRSPPPLTPAFCAPTSTRNAE